MSEPHRTSQFRRRSRRAAVVAFHRQLAIDCRSTFAPPDHGPHVALAFGVHRQLGERYGDVPVKTRHAFLRRYTNAPAYRRLLITSAPRIDLGGLVVGRVTEAEFDGDMPCAG
jgi:ProQ/FINO family